ncbi:MAG: hypothetical protein KGP12_03720 [Actinomycetales bacterium]|nr:hypothetical protein [Actinomycetales bacterium]
MGTATPDLTALDLTTPDLTASDLDTPESAVARIPILARVDMGTIIVLVPADQAMVTLQLRVGMGTVEVNRA